MKQAFKLIVITPADFFEGEIDILHQLFAMGLQYLHVRKPNATEAEIANFIERINPLHYSKLVLHQYHHLAKVYNLKGVHFNGKNPINQEYTAYQQSYSAHGIAEIEQLNVHLDYVFISPVFDSISKTDYKAEIGLADLERLNNSSAHPIIALGGLNADTIIEAINANFAGAALLGALWQNPEQAIQKFNQIQALCRTQDLLY